MATKRDFTPKFIENARGKNGRRVETRDSKSPLCLRHGPAGRHFFARVRIADGEQIRVTYPKCVAADGVKEARAWPYIKREKKFAPWMNQYVHKLADKLRCAACESRDFYLRPFKPSDQKPPPGG